MSNASANRTSARETENEIQIEKSSVTLPGIVDKVIPSVHPSEPDKAQIVVEGADDLYREIRISNALETSNGKKVALKPGAEVEVTIEADAKATTS